MNENYWSYLVEFDKDYIGAPEAIQRLFSIELSKHKEFKDSIYSFIRHRGNGTAFLKVKDVPQINTGASSRNNLFIHESSLPKLHNAIILQAFFPSTQKTKAIFTDTKKRKQAAKLMRFILQDRQSVLGMKMQSKKVDQLLDIMDSNKQLDKNKLPNPFPELPQISLEGITSITQAILTQSASLTHLHGEAMLLHHFNGELEEAYKASILLISDTVILQEYQKIIQAQYSEAREFDSFLEILLN